MSGIKTLRLISVFALIAVAAAAVNERAFLKRYFTYSGDPLVLPMSWYEPLDPIKGNADDSLPDAGMGQLTISQRALDEVATYAEEQGSQALIVIHKGVVQLEQYWNGADRNTRFNPQSMSKSVLGLLMGIAIEDGHISSINDPVGQYVEEWQDDPRGKIEIEQALRMAGGLEQMSTSYEISLYTRGSWYNFGDDFNGMLLDLEQVDPPGEKFEYNNEETNLLGIAIERATGRRYVEYLSEKIWKPLGLADADMFLDRPGGAVMKSCCIFSRPYDWAKLGLLVENEGKWQGTQIVPASWIKSMTTPSTTADFYGHQIWLGSSYIKSGEAGQPGVDDIVAPEEYLADDMVIFLGYGDQRVWVSPSNDLVIVRATTQWAPSWVETRIPNIILRALQN